MIFPLCMNGDWGPSWQSGVRGRKITASGCEAGTHHVSACEEETDCAAIDFHHRENVWVYQKSQRQLSVFDTLGKTKLTDTCGAAEVSGRMARQNAGKKRDQHGRYTKRYGRGCGTKLESCGAGSRDTDHFMWRSSSFLPQIDSRVSGSILH